MCSFVLLPMLAFGGCELIGGSTDIRVDSLFVFTDRRLMTSARVSVENTGTFNADAVS
jgi:hypothetical protein